MRKLQSVTLLILGFSLSAIGCEEGESAPESQSPEIIGGEASANDSSGESGERAE